jgi:DNA-binding IclR family transcriptional regulator
MRSPADPAVADAAAVTSSLRTLRLFEVFAEQQRPLSLTELATALEIPKSSCHAIVTTLADRGYLYTLAKPRGLYPTKKLSMLMERVTAKDAFIQRATPLLEALRDQTEETVILGKLHGQSVLYLEVFESPQAIRYSARQGDRKPLHSSSIGKAMLGTLKESELRAALATLPLPPVTESTTTDPDRLFDDIRRAKKRGYYQTQGENVRDVWAVAATVTMGSEHFGVAVAGPQHRMKPYLAVRVRELLGMCNVLARMNEAT